MRITLIPFVISLSVLLGVWTPSVNAQSGADYTRWKNWCINTIGGTVSGTPSKPVCIPPSTQSPSPPTHTSPTGPTAEELDRQARQREAERIRREKERKQSEDALKAAEEAAKEADFIRKRDEAVVELKGVDDSTKLVQKEISATDPKPCGPSLNAMVVDACDPGTDLPKGVSDAIEGAFKDSPRSVTDRVRKGFNAVMQRDWKLASAWFKDALNRDPANKKLLSLLALANYEKARTNLRIPRDVDMEFLFFPDYVTTPLGTRRPREVMIDSKGMVVDVPVDYKGSVQTYIRLKDRPDLLAVPTADDLNLLFPGSFAPAKLAKAPLYRIDASGTLIELPRDYNGAEPVYIKGIGGHPVQVPKNADQTLIFPETRTPLKIRSRRRG